MSATGARVPAICVHESVYMVRSDVTTMGGTGSVFPRTISLWSDFIRARTDDLTRRNAIIDSLMRAYWKPVYCYLRRKGYDNERAKDLTQGFFCEIVLGRDLFQQADLERGRFRTFLLTALDRYVIDAIRRENRRKRVPTGGIVTLDFGELGDWALPPCSETPVQAFYYGWVADLLDRVLTEIEDEYRGAGRSVHWEVFRMRVLDPIMEGQAAPPLPDVCEKCGVTEASQASNMIATVKRRFHNVLNRVLRDLVRSDAEAEEEFREILQFLSDFGAR